jgi:hypothetical protein
MIGCKCSSSFMYYKYEYLTLALPTGGVFLYNISLPIYIYIYIYILFRIVSAWETIKQGVLQGSVLGPLLFIMNVIDYQRA